ncbi:hypothetical protein WPS_20960 [Vulcanimicrobium alpinum]|uniref:Uncharacterized protein n=1 Tax=Vulcanimicrobium alpinum TaxID=3016050 RepID=A0AAN1XXN6_UNVUL|nr:hypothetical protein [Vulcanimicrobium alpinum]BDE06820.1 hypothetical protein WPS_20960 [Vulcanimicrobium alpinum]
MRGRHARRAVAIAVVLLIGAAGARAEGFATLHDVLGGLRQLPGIAFTNVAEWSGRPAAPAESAAGTAPFAEVRAERAILALPAPDREATLWWLQSRGRKRLHERGATNAEIGPARYPVDLFGERGPNTRLARAMHEWRRLPYGGDMRSVGARDPEITNRVRVLGGFAVVARDGGAELHCLSFRNLAANTATSIRWRFDFFGADGTQLTSITDERRGSFAPNIDIISVPNVATYNNPGLGMPHALTEGCRRNDTRNESTALARAASFAVSIAGVTYDDGTTIGLSAFSTR